MVPGRKFGKYTIIKKLGAGGMGEVYLAESSEFSGLKKRVALKVMAPECSSKPELIQKFKAEAQISLQLNHGSVVAVHEFGIQGGRFFLVFDYVNGKPLSELMAVLRLEQESLAPEHCAQIIREACSGLDYVHRAADQTTGKPLNIIHRDISPQNLMIDREGQVKIIDFGVARASLNLDKTQTQSVIGKLRYVSPEQVRSEPLNAQCDIYSLGVIFWELLAGQRIFEGLSDYETVNLIAEFDVKNYGLPKDIPVEFENILVRALACDPKNRYASADEMRSDLTAYLNRHHPKYSSKHLREAVVPLLTELDDSELEKPSKPTQSSTPQTQSPVFVVTPKDRTGWYRFLKLSLFCSLLWAIHLKQDRVIAFLSPTKAYVEKIENKVKSAYAVPPSADRALSETQNLPLPEDSRSAPPPDTKVGLEVGSSPPGAEIIINSLPINKRTPNRISVENSGALSVTLRLSGYRDCSALISPLAGTYSCKLEKVSK